jgi:hypothetical protein
MRNLLVSLAAVAVLAACGPSGRDLGLAKSARYQGDKLVLFGAMKAAAESKQQIDQSDETTLTVMTKGRWYTPEGLASNWKPGEVLKDGRQAVEDRSLNISFAVRLLPDGDKWIVHVDPTILEFREGQPVFNKLRADDPSLPGWATGKGDQLAYEIYQSLKGYEVKGVGGAAPPPATTPAATTPAAAPVDPAPPAAPAPQ